MSKSSKMPHQKSEKERQPNKPRQTKPEVKEEPNYKSCGNCGAMSDLEATMCWKCNASI